MNDAIKFLREKLCVPYDKNLVDSVGKNIKLDRVIRLMDEFSAKKVEQDSADQNTVAKKMYYSLCSELTDLCEGNEEKELEEMEAYDRIEEIFKLTDLLKKEYSLDV